MRLILILTLMAAIGAALMVTQGGGGVRTLPADVALSGAESANQQAYDVLRYDLKLRVLPARRWIIGINTVTLTALEALETIDLDLDPQLDVDAVRQGDVVIPYVRRGGRLTADLADPLDAGAATTLSVSYHGYPHQAARAPWDGGFVWAETPSGDPWIATAVQGHGCDLWWPCKDSLTDKPDSMTITIDVPDGLVAAANGVLDSAAPSPGGGMRYVWSHPHPIAPYLVALNIAPYSRIERRFTSVNGEEFPIVFYALPDNVDKAAALVDSDLIPQLRFFEDRLGPYPFGDMKLGIAETPHLGMEHQTINAYGNQYRADPYGFDWLLHHELSHEWFGNLMTQARPRDFWLHEGYGLYMQALYTEALSGRALYTGRMIETLKTIKNCHPLVPEDLEPGTLPSAHDVYTKGAWVLHTLRHLIGDAAFWRATRRLLYGTAQTDTLQSPISGRYRSTEDFIRIVAEESGETLDWFWAIYAREASLPALTKHRDGNMAVLRWTHSSGKPFPMPVRYRFGGEMVDAPMTNGETRIALPAAADAAFDNLVPDPDMHVLRAMPVTQTCNQPQSPPDTDQ